MRNLKALLVGQPNVGKSSLLNALVGMKVVVSNYPGTTVEVTRAEKVFDDVKIELVDTPGIYSISDRSQEEKVTEKALFEEEIDGVTVIVDSSSLERSLYLALQILEAEIPTIIALNFVEEAEKKGVKIDSEQLGEILNIPVIPINPLTGKGMSNFIDSLLRIGEEREVFRVKYDDHVEHAINEICSRIKETSIQKRFIAIRVLEGDEDFSKYLKDKRIVEKVKERLIEHPKVAEDISITRYGTASFIAEKVTQIIPLKTERGNIEEKVDDVLLHSIWGTVTTGLLLLALFGILLFLGNIIQDFLMGLTEGLLSFLGVMDNSTIAIVLVQGLTGVAAGVSIALPYVFLFYLFLGLLEDVGLLSRFVVNTERFLKKLGLPGKAFIPLALGLGCTVPAVRATRVLASEKEQYRTASLFAFVPCSSRIAIILGIVRFYGGLRLALNVLVTSLIAGLVWALAVKRVIHIKSEPLLLELPPYRKPLIKNVLAKSWIRMKDFIYIVIPLLALGGIIYGIFDMLGLTEVLVKPFSPVTAWLGLPNATIIPLLFGFIQKDLTGAMLLSVLEGEISLILTPLQIYTFGVATTIGIPCIIALGMLITEFRLKRAILLVSTSIGYGILFAGLAWRILSIL